MQNAQVRCFFDGAVQPHNPGGHGGYGVVIFSGSERIHWEAGYIGRWPKLSNNVAEYAGIISVFRYLLTNGISEALVYGDADLVVNQVNGRWRAKQGEYLPYYVEAYALRARLPNVVVEWIPRERNGAADDMSKIAVAQRVVTFALDASVEPLPQPKFRRRKRTRDMCRDIESMFSAFDS